MEIVSMHEDEMTAYTMARNGRVPALKVGGKWRIRKMDLARWVELQIGKPDSNEARRPS
jgi:excisionase family DNA binding protein